MPPVRLVTLDRVELSGPTGPIALADPRHLAMLVRLAAAPGRSLGLNELLLPIWPHLTPQRGAAAVADAVATFEAVEPGMVVAGTGRWTLSSAVECDLDRAGPADSSRFGAGLALPDTPEWDDWVASTRREIGGRPAPPVRRRAVPALLGLAGLAVGVLAGYLVLRPQPVEGFRAGDRVLLADIDHGGRDSSLGRSLRMATEIALRASKRIELVSRSRVAGSEGPGGLDVPAAIAAAEREGIPWVVAVAVAPDGGKQRITTRLLRVSDGAAVFTAATAAIEPLLLIEAFGQSLRNLDRRLGESSRTLDARPTLAFATSADLEALRAYTDGLTAWTRGDFALAHDYWDRAVVLDTGFALAMGSLGSWHYYHHNRSEGEEWYRKALARLDRLTEWERLQLEERYAGWRGDHDSALAVSRVLTVRYPRAMTWSNLGTGLLQAGRCGEALEPFRRALELDSRHLNSHINLATCLKILGRHEEARESYLAAERIDPGALYRNNINLEYAGAVLLAGRPAEAESALVRMTGRPGMADKALGFRGLGYLMLWRGEIGRARDYFRRAADLSRQQRASNSLIRNLGLLAAAERAAGDVRAAHRTLLAIDSIAAANPDLAPGFLGFAVEAHAAEGDAPGIRNLLEAIRKRADPRSDDDSLLIHFVEGTLAHAEGNPRAAVAAFDRGRGFQHGANLAVRRAGALIELGELDSARVELERVVAKPKFGSEDQLGYLAALIQVGLLLERAGKPDEAIASHRRFLELWRNGDAEVPDLILVRQRLNALVSRRDR